MTVAYLVTVEGLRGPEAQIWYLDKEGDQVVGPKLTPLGAMIPVPDCLALRARSLEIKEVIKRAVAAEVAP